MRELDHLYSPEDVIFANLREVTGRMDLLCEQTRAHLRELAAQIAESRQDVEQLLASLPDHRPPTEGVDSAAALNATLLSQWQRHRAAWESVMLCTELKQRLASRGELPTAEEFFLGESDAAVPASDLIVYQRSSYADEAYLQFAPLLPAARSAYAHSFAAVCEEVYNGLCAFCILPVESSSEGRLNSFSRLIDRYGLRIAATCDITATDGSRVTRFALLRRRMLPLLGDTEGERYLELSLPQDGTLSAARLLTAAELLGLPLERMDSTPSVETPESHRTRLLFRVGKGDLVAFLLYLAMEAPQIEPIGLYPHVGARRV